MAFGKLLGSSLDTACEEQQSRRDANLPLVLGAPLLPSSVGLHPSFDGLSLFPPLSFRGFLVKRFPLDGLQHTFSLDQALQDLYGLFNVAVVDVYVQYGPLNS